MPKAAKKGYANILGSYAALYINKKEDGEKPSSKGYVSEELKF